jgi:hypothetical protein
VVTREAHAFHCLGQNFGDVAAVTIRNGEPDCDRAHVCSVAAADNRAK